MKRIFLYSCLVIAVTAASCSSMKKDCKGNRHYRQPNGIYL